MKSYTPQETLKGLGSTLGDAIELLNELPGASDKLIVAQLKTLYANLRSANRVCGQLEVLTHKTKGQGWNDNRQKE